MSVGEKFHLCYNRHRKSDLLSCRNTSSLYFVISYQLYSSSRTCARERARTHNIFVISINIIIIIIIVVVRAHSAPPIEQGVSFICSRVVTVFLQKVVLFTANHRNNRSTKYNFNNYRVYIQNAKENLETRTRTRRRATERLQTCGAYKN